MKQVLIFGGFTVAAIIGVIALNFGLASMGMISKSFFGKWNEEIRYEIHKESQTYRDGMQRTLADAMKQYQDASAAGKTVIKKTIEHQFSQTDTSQFPAYLQDFLRTEIGIY